MIRLIETVDGENATAERVESLIVADLVLTAKVLHLANSAYYGLSRFHQYHQAGVAGAGVSRRQNLALGIAR